MASSMSAWPDEFAEKIAKKVSQYIFDLVMHNFYRKKVAKRFDYSCNFHMTAESKQSPNCEKSPILVTLINVNKRCRNGSTASG
jgi:hypothetical protein